MNRRQRDSDSAYIGLKRIISVLPNDYLQLENIPKINGVTLSGDISATDLNLLSSNSADYETMRLSDLAGKGMYIPTIGENEESVKVPVDDLIEEKQVKVTETLDEGVSIGTIQLVIIKANGG